MGKVVIDSEVQVFTREFTDGRDLRKHKDNLRFLTDGPETMIDRKQQKIVDKKNGGSVNLKRL